VRGYLLWLYKISAAVEESVMRLIKLCFFAGLAGLLPQISWMLAVQAQSIVEQQLCRYSGKYVVFAQRPLQVLPIRVPLPRGDRNNIELAHEHIFFCNNGRVERNIGFGPDGMFSESALSEKYVLIDEEQYDSKIMTQILPKQLLSKQCHETNPVGEYGLRTNNCQDFAERVRQLYWRRMFQGTWNAEGYQCPFGTYHKEVISMQVSGSSLVATKVDGAGDKCVPTGSRTFSGSIPNNVSKGSPFPINYVVGHPNNPASGTAPGNLKIVDANTLYSGSSTGEGITFRRAKTP
jgi:hypothetical protein